jgi:pimeloyl-ACP methyl ester carboxylesterase
MRAATREHHYIPTIMDCENCRVGKTVIDKAQTHKARVNEIDIAYKILGAGEPLILIMGFGGSMNNWDVNVIKELSLHNKIVVFDNRGVGGTTHGKKYFTISQFANDTAGLMDALNIKKGNVLGFSMGGMIAQEVVLHNPEKVNKLVLYASHCGGNESRYANNLDVIETLSNLSGLSNNILLRLAALMFPKKWRIEHPKYAEIFNSKSSLISTDTIINQSKAVFSWKGTCARIRQIIKSTLLITGTDDILVPPVNSTVIAGRIPNSKLVQIVDGGHGLMYQFPEKFTNIVSAFLAN